MKNPVLMLGIIAHFVLVGADIFGQVVISPVVLSAPPVSLSMFQGDYAYNSTVFWQPANMIALALLLIGLIVNWNTPRRALLLAWLVGTITITVASLSFIFPEYGEIVSTPFSAAVDPQLVDRGADWRIISFVRMVAFLGIGLLPLLALTKKAQYAADA